MKRNLTFVFCSALVLSAAALFGQAAAQETSILQWAPAAQKLLKDSSFTVTGRNLLTTRPFEVDPGKTYTIKATFRCQNGKDGKFPRIYLSFIPRKANGRDISCWNNFALPGTYTTLVENAVKGSTVLKVKDGSKFQTVSFGCLVFNAKEDFSDLPNTFMLGNAVKSKIQKDGYWEITMVKPLIQNVAAGTGIRQHRHGGFLYPAGSKLAVGEWQTLQGSVSGLDLTASWKNTRWPVGTSSARGALLINSSAKDQITDIKDINITVK